MGKSRSVPYLPIQPNYYSSRGGEIDTRPFDLSKVHTPVYQCDTCQDNPNQCLCDIDEPTETLDTSRFVHHVRPPGIKCSNSNCPYNDNQYSKQSGLCLNCLDDERRNLDEYHSIYGAEA